jgi:hypothetical protein
MISAIVAAASLCVAVPSHREPIYYEKGVTIEPVHWMTACNITPAGWRPMSEAPRDGTVIEIRDAFGLLPTYSINRWADWADFGGHRAWVDAKPRPPCHYPAPTALKDKSGAVIGFAATGSCFTSGFDTDAEPGLAWRALTVAPAAYREHNPTPADWRAAMKASSR